MSIGNMQADQAVADFLGKNSGDFAPSFKFGTVGDTIAGTITGTNVVDGTDLDGNPQQSLVVEIEADDGGRHAVWCPSGKGITRAVAKAVAGTGNAMPAVGGRLAVKHSGLGTPPKPGLNAPKLFEASYRAPDGTAAPVAPPAATGPAVDDLI